VLSREEMERYCELIAAVKLRTSNKKGRCLSTGETIRLLERFGVETPEGLVKTDPGVLKRSTVNRYLRQWGFDKQSWTRQPAAVRFQAEHSNECWQFDLSPSDLKQIKQPPWLRADRAAPTLMLFSVVDDRSGVAYQEYRCVYGEDVEAALRFLFNAMSEKAELPFQGIPEMIYTDNGPIAKSRVFQQVMRYLKIELRTHLPAGGDGRRVTARSKGKVERPFRTVKEMHETLYHFHEPSTEEEANAWLMNFLLRYNSMQHRSEPHTRIEDWIDNLPPSGIRAMCGWERFRTFAREADRRKVGIDARVSTEGVSYVVDHALAGETVVLWWGLFDN
jgi:transposase InsO family protein